MKIITTILICVIGYIITVLITRKVIILDYKRKEIDLEEVNVIFMLLPVFNIILAISLYFGYLIYKIDLTETAFYKWLINKK